jgi:hypothetical protein
VEDTARTSNSQGSEFALPEPSDGRGSRAARNMRTRRPPKRRYDDDSPPPVTPAAAPHTATSLAAPDSDDATRVAPSAAAMPAAGAVPPAKRGRGGSGGATGAAATAAPPASAAALRVVPHDMQAPQQMLINLRTQFENMMNALKDPNSLVNQIFTRAQERILAMCADAGLNLNNELDRAVYSFALQVRGPRSSVPDALPTAACASTHRPDMYSDRPVLCFVGNPL